MLSEQRFFLGLNEPGDVCSTLIPALQRTCGLFNSASLLLFPCSHPLLSCRNAVCFWELVNVSTIWVLVLVHHSPDEQTRAFKIASFSPQITRQYPHGSSWCASVLSVTKCLRRKISHDVRGHSFRQFVSTVPWRVASGM